MMRYSLMTAVRFFTVALCLGLAGCPKAPLGDPKTSEVDPKLGGYWLHVADTDAKDRTILSIAPMDERVYVVQFWELPKGGDGSDEKVTTSEAYRAWITEVKGVRFLTVEPIAAAAHKAFHEDVNYAIYRIELAGDELKAHLLNDDLPGLSEVRSAAGMRKLIEEKLDDPALVNKEAVKLSRLKGDDPAAKKLIERLPIMD